MGNGSGVSRGDRNRNARLVRLRALVPVTNAIVGIDLAGSKQMVVVTGQLHAVITTGQAWDPVTAAHGTRRASTPLAA